MGGRVERETKEPAVTVGQSVRYLWVLIAELTEIFFSEVRLCGKLL